MTFSIIAFCAHTRRFGVASGTFSIACGRRNESIQMNVGVSKSQAFYLRQVDVTALHMLRQGHTPLQIVAQFSASDPDIDYRQFGVIDRESRIAVHTGPKTKPWSGHYIGKQFATYGNVLKGPETLQGIVDGFLGDPQAPLEERLLRAIEGGRDAGGQFSEGEHLPERSAWLRVAGPTEEDRIDLRVDLHADAITELRSVYEEYKCVAGGNR
jgi:uncharacterized Ntn-hydrolase superfamily protein